MYLLVPSEKIDTLHTTIGRYLMRMMPPATAEGRVEFVKYDMDEIGKIEVEILRGARNVSHKNVMAGGDLKIIDKSETSGAYDPQTEADRRAQYCIVQSLQRHFNNITIIGEKIRLGIEPPKQKKMMSSKFRTEDAWIIGQRMAARLDHEAFPLHKAAFFNDTHSIVQRDPTACPELEMGFNEDVLLSDRQMSADLKDIKENEVLVWVDPLDGTSEMALAVMNKNLVAGVIHQPYHSTSGRTVLAIQGCGVQGFISDTGNAQKTVVTTRSHLSESVSCALEALKTKQLADNVEKVGGAGFMVMKVFQRGRREESEAEIDEDVDVLMLTDIVNAHMSTKTIGFEQVYSGWVFKHAREEQMGDFPVNFYSVEGLKLTTQKRREHLSSDDVKKNKSILHSLTSGPGFPVCVVTEVLRKLKTQTNEKMTRGKPHLLKMFQDLGDFYMEFKWDFQSWTPLLSRILPSDVCLIYKKGNLLRMDTTYITCSGASQQQQHDQKAPKSASDKRATFGKSRQNAIIGSASSGSGDGGDEPPRRPGKRTLNQNEAAPLKKQKKEKKEKKKPKGSDSEGDDEGSEYKEKGVEDGELETQFRELTAECDGTSSRKAQKRNLEAQEDDKKDERAEKTSKKDDDNSGGKGTEH